MYFDTGTENNYCIIKDDLKYSEMWIYILKKFITSKVAVEPVSIRHIYYGLPVKCKNYLDK